MATLSPREQDVVRLVALGKTTKEISADLGIAESTVSWHVTNVLGKLEASSRAEAVARALTEGLLDVQRPSASAATATSATPTQSTPPALPTIPAPTAAPALSNAPLPMTTAGAPGVGPLPSVTP